jgi:hypothetical protein
MPFRIHPEFHIPSLRATRVFPKPGCQPGDRALVCGSFYAISLHGKKDERALKNMSNHLIMYILAFQQQWHSTCPPGRRLSTRLDAIGGGPQWNAPGDLDSYNNWKLIATNTRIDPGPIKTISVV